MALQNIFRKKKKEELVKPTERPKEQIFLEKPAASSNIKKGEKIGAAYKVLKTPHITEKAGDLTQRNQYVFKIWPGANKIEIKKAVQDVYRVDVLDVRIIKIPKKARRLGRQKGWREGYKKAIIKIKEGQKIEVLPR